MKIDVKQLLKRSLKKKIAIPAFNVSSIEALKAIFAIAGKMKRPVIIETSRGESEHLVPETLAVMCESLARTNSVDYALHMDRCDDFDWMERVLKAGYNSISAEFNVESQSRNIKLSKEARALTDRFNAQLEGVLEVVPMTYYKEKDERTLSSVEEAKQFVAEVTSDSLVVSVGNQSGRFKSEGGIDLELLRSIHESLPEVPIVLHGGSFMPKSLVKKARQFGACKINVNSELRIEYTKGLKKNIKEKPEEYAPYRLLSGVEESIAQVVSQKIDIFQN